MIPRKIRLIPMERLFEIEKASGGGFNPMVNVFSKAGEACIASLENLRDIRHAIDRGHGHYVGWLPISLASYELSGEQLDV